MTQSPWPSFFAVSIMNSSLWPHQNRLISPTVSTILVDLYFATLPWFLIWKLRKPLREKMIIACSLSLSVL